MAVADLISFDNAVFSAYVFWSAILVLKMLAMAFLTGRYRHKNKVFANPEDIRSDKVKVKFGDEDVERVRRAHRNDMENILPFFIIGFLYVLTDPSSFLAITLFRIVGLARISHTLVYAVYVVPQPARGISFMAAFVATAYMALQVACRAL